jgi:sigma-B regulation protein RsbU (phosphoserine phosphatase)
LSCHNTKQILDELNRFLVADTRKDMFMSMLVMKWDSVEKIFYWTGAGHEHLIVYRGKTKKCEAIRAGGIVLGMMKKADKFLKESQLKVEPGDSVILYTDGVTECIGTQGKMLELDHFIPLVEKYGHLSSKEICDSLFNEVMRFMGSTPQHDDITLVALKRV